MLRAGPMLKNISQVHLKTLRLYDIRLLYGYSAFDGKKSIPPGFKLFLDPNRTSPANR